MGRSDRPIEPNLNDIWIYVNSNPCMVINTSQANPPKSMYLGCTRHHLKSDKRVIVYKTKKTTTIDDVEYTGNVYYLLGDNATLSYLQYNNLSAPYGMLYNRNEPNTGQQDGSATGMNTITVSDHTFFENPTTKNFSLNSGGTNGYHATYTTAWKNYDREFVPVSKISSLTFTVNKNTDNTNFWVGIEPSYYIGNNSLQTVFKYASGTYTATNIIAPTLRQYPWKWANGGNDSIVTWADLQKNVYNTFMINDGTTNNATTEDMFDGNPLFVNVYVSERYEDCIKYLETGELPSDAKITVSKDDYGTPDLNGGDDKNDDNSTDEEHGNPKDEPSNNPNNSLDDDEDSPTIGSINIYQIGREDLQKFISWFWNESITTDWTDLIANTLTGIYGNLTQCITSIKKMYIPSHLYSQSTSARSTIKVGRYLYDGDGAFNDLQAIESIPLASSLIGVINIDEKYNNFVDYAPYTAIELYLPYVGIVPLDVNLIMGKLLYIYASASPYTGEIQYTVFSKHQHGETLLGIYIGQCAIDVPFSLDNFLTLFTNASNSVSNALSTISGVNVPSIGGTSSPMNVSMGASNQLSMHTPSQCALIIKRKRYTLPSNFASKVGYKCCKKHNLKNLNGLVVVKNPLIKEWVGTSPTESEVNEIYDLMASGIVIQ